MRLASRLCRWGRPYEFTLKAGFTLIELSIVLVIIGLIVGGVLVGQDLIAAAAVRAQVTQIGRYNTAVNTFRGKYGYIPGDIPDPAASSFGFAQRGLCTGQGDGDGFIVGTGHTTCGTEGHTISQCGEPLFLWQDLYQAGLNDFKPTLVSSSSNLSNQPYAVLAQYFPPIKIREGGLIVPYSGGLTANDSYNAAIAGYNYWSISAAANINWYLRGGTQVLKVSEAYAIDAKMDDGLPQSGAVIAAYLGGGAGELGAAWSSGGNPASSGAANYFGASSNSLPTTAATTGSAITCYDNSTSADGQTAANGNPQHYSIEIQGGANINCNLSFRWQ